MIKDPKARGELKFWKGRQRREGTFRNDYYEYFYTGWFGLTRDFYIGKNILDIGCGPRGSLEWADGALDRVGVDPLADEYVKLNGGTHKMRYVQSGSEHMPFRDGYFDVVCSFNSLDHVDDLDQTIREIKRVLIPGGTFLLLTDVNHDPTPLEPVTYSWDIISSFEPDLEVFWFGCYEKLDPRGMYESLMQKVEYDHRNPAKRYGILAARFTKL